jgi:hypothetical protein
LREPKSTIEALHIRELYRRVGAARKKQYWILIKNKTSRNQQQEWDREQKQQKHKLWHKSRIAEIEEYCKCDSE